MSNISPQTQEALPALLRSIADQAQAFARAEIEILKIESQRIVTKAAVALVVLMGSGLLLAIALSLSAAAVVVARGGSPASALLTAAGVDLVIASVATLVVISWARRRVEDAATTTQLANVPHHGSTVS